MLRAAALSSSRVARRPLILTYAAAAPRFQQRSFSVIPRWSAPALKADDAAGKGSEGVHPKGEVFPSGGYEKAGNIVSHPSDNLIPVKSDNTSALTSVTGDWVLFHPVYTPEEVNAVKVLQHERKTISDKIASACVAVLRYGFDVLSQYKHKDIPAGSNMSLQELRAKGYSMDDHKWLLRILFLETVAGVPGMVAATLRHLRSLRLMRRDAGWIHTLLEESENERMHLMTFMTIKQPSLWFRALVLGAQGVFYNAFFLAYLASPKTAHRFVGFLEEEAVYTYTCLIADIKAGRLPEWEDMPAPAIAIDYWRLRKDAKMLDVIQAVRADEATHRFVNHSLANLNHTEDVNPFALREPDMAIKGTKIALERSEAADFIKETREILDEGVSKPSSSPLEKPSMPFGNTAQLPGSGEQVVNGLANGVRTRKTTGYTPNGETYNELAVLATLLGTTGKTAADRLSEDVAAMRKQIDNLAVDIETYITHISTLENDLVDRQTIVPQQPTTSTTYTTVATQGAIIGDQGMATFQESQQARRQRRRAKGTDGLTLCQIKTREEAVFANTSAPELTVQKRPLVAKSTARHPTKDILVIFHNEEDAKAAREHEGWVGQLSPNLRLQSNNYVIVVQNVAVGKFDPSNVGDISRIRRANPGVLDSATRFLRAAGKKVNKEGEAEKSRGSLIVHLAHGTQANTAIQKGEALDGQEHLVRKSRRLIIQCHNC
ncbi:hypothetical protein FRB90_000006 [Tulasnella sp. 427]|nr:hypothetical protein FRB90_000006 [Tulasnella sp. 427]